MAAGRLERRIGVGRGVAGGVEGVKRQGTVVLWEMGLVRAATVFRSADRGRGWRRDMIERGACGVRFARSVEYSLTIVGGLSR